MGILQPKVGTINLFPHYGRCKLCLLKIMKRLILLILVSVFYSSFAWAETFTTRQALSDDETFTVDSGDTYFYAGDKVIDAVGHSNVTVINNGNIIAHRTEAYPTEFRTCGSSCDDTIEAGG